MIRFEHILPAATRVPVEPGAADAALDDREQEERALRAALADERRRVVAEAHDAGYREGWQAAQADVKERLEAPTLVLAEELRQQLHRVQAIMVESRPYLAQSIVDHAIRLAEAITGAPFAMDRVGLQERLIVEAGAERSRGTHLVCRGHPETLAGLEAVLQRMDCAVESDPAMARGGIRLALKNVELNRRIAEWDASVERQVDALRAQFAPTEQRNDC